MLQIDLQIRIPSIKCGGKKQYVLMKQRISALLRAHAVKLEASDPSGMCVYGKIDYGKDTGSVEWNVMGEV